MRKLLILSLFLLSSCSQYDPKRGSSTKPSEDYRIVIIDGCEYVEVDEGQRYQDHRIYSLTHKGNCKNHDNTTK